MTDIVERLQERATNGDGWTRPVAADALTEIKRLRADLLKAEMGAEMAGLENTMRAVAMARREGIEAAAQAAENCLHPSAERTAHAAVEDAVAAIRELLEGKG